MGNSILIGYFSNASTNIFVGECAGACSTNQYFSMFIGHKAGACASGCLGHLFIGHSAGCSAYLGTYYSTAIGHLAGQDTGTQNVYIGYMSGMCTGSGFNNVYVGQCSGQCHQGSGNVLVGREIFTRGAVGGLIS